MRGKVALDPATPAPENQILPQAFAKGTRPATTPLNGAQITDFVKQGDNGYLLTYRIGTKNGYVQYSWDASNKYTFRLTDTSGAATVNVYQR
jgi:Flp pilus assembly protein TadG